MPSRRRSRKKGSPHPSVDLSPTQSLASQVAAEAVPDASSDCAFTLSGRPTVPSPRPYPPIKSYHHRIIHDAVCANTVVILPSGAGKTLIAAQVILRMGTPALFLVPTCYLVEKQGAALTLLTDVDVRPYQGGAVLPNRFDVLVSTPKAFEIAQANVAKNPHLQWDKFRAVVFDEAQHVLKDHPYRKLALNLRASSARPRVIGLTAAFVGVLHQDKVRSLLQSICYDLLVERVDTAGVDELAEFGRDGGDAVNRISEMVIARDVPQGVLAPEGRKPHLMLKTFFSRVLSSQATPFANRLARCALKMEVTMADLDPQFIPPIQSNLSLKQWSSVAHRIACNQRDDLALMYAQLEFWYEALRVMIVSWEEDEYAGVLLLKMTHCDSQKSCAAWPVAVKDCICDFWRYAPHRFARLDQLRRVLIQKCEELPGFRGLLLVQQRLTTHIIEYFVRNDPDLSPRFRTACLYATSSSASPSFSISKLQAKQNLDAFKQGQVNLLIATVVAEESMDIPSANCVIRFDSTHNQVYSPRYHVTEPKNQVPALQNRAPVSQGQVHSPQDIDVEVELNQTDAKSVLLLPAPERKQPEPTAMPTSAIYPVSNEDLKARLKRTQTALEINGKTYLEGNADLSNCVSKLRGFCEQTKTPLESTVKYENNEYFVCMKYCSILRSHVANGRGSTRAGAATDAALQLVVGLRYQVLSAYAHI